MRIKRKLHLHYGVTVQVEHVLYIIFERLIIPSLTALRYSIQYVYTHVYIYIYI